MNPRPQLNSFISLLVPCTEDNTVSTFTELRTSNLVDLNNVEDISYRGFPVTRIRLIRTFESDIAIDHNAFLAARVLLTCQGIELPYTFEGTGMAVATRLADLFSALVLTEGVLTEFAFCRPTARAKANWEDGIQHRYAPEEHEFYKMARKLVAAKLKDFLLQEIKSNNKKKMPVRLISLGCGEGDDIHHVRIQLSSDWQIADAFGLDISESNIASARRKYKNNADFFVSKASDLEAILKNRKSIKHVINVALAVGFFTRHVQNGTQEALLLLQRVSRLVDVIAITGLTAPLITIDMANAMGLTGTLLNYRLGDGDDLEIKMIYFLRHPNELELAALLLTKFNSKKNLLDLSMSAKPLLHLQLFAKLFPEKLPEIFYIDLTFAYFDVNETELELAAALNPYTDVQEIYYNNARNFSDDKFNFIRAVTRPHAKHEVPFYHGEIETVLEVTSPKPPVKIAVTKPRLSANKDFCFFKVHTRNRDYVTELQKMVGNEVVRFDKKKVFTSAYLKMSWLAQLSPAALDELSSGAEPVEEAWGRLDGCGIDRTSLTP